MCDFIRLGTCNLACQWCDSEFTWNGRRFDLSRELSRRSVDEIIAGLSEDVDEVVITGGEPLLQQGNSDWGPLLRKLVGRGRYIAVETNGTIEPNPITARYVSHYSISPKLRNAGPHKPGQDPGMASWPRYVRQCACLKFVVTSPEDVKEAVALADGYRWPRRSVWMMPEGTCTARLQESFGAIVEEALRHRVNVCHRLHVLAFGDRRGV